MKIEGDFTQEGPPLQSKATIYVFFKDSNFFADDASEIPIIKVGRIEKRDGRTFINLSAVLDSNGASAGVGLGSRDFKEIEKHVVWLNPLEGPGNQKTAPEVVLCESTCAEVVKAERPHPVSSPSVAQNAHTPPTLNPKAPSQKSNLGSIPILGAQHDRTGPAAAGPGTAGTEPPGPPKPSTPPKSATDRDVGRNSPASAIAGLNPDAEIDIRVLDETGTSLSLFPRIRPCSFNDKAANVRAIFKHLYENCAEFDRTSGYEIEHVNIDLNGKPTITFWLKSIKPRTVSTLRITVLMNDGAPLTKNCTVRYTIEPADGDGKPEAGLFNSPPPNLTNREYTFQALLKNPIAWRNSKLRLSTVEGADCEPEEANYSRQIDDQLVSAGGMVAVNNIITLRSTLGEALIVLNAYSGIPSVNGSSSTDQYYPLKDVNEYRDILTEILKRIVVDLKGKVKTIMVISNSENGLYSEQRAVNLSERDRFDPGALIHLARRNFDLTAMMDDVSRYEIMNKRPFKYKIFIGQSGLGDQENYCDEFARQLRDRKLGDRVYFYTFSAVSNNMSPKDAELLPDTKNFPTRACPHNLPVRQTVLFPEGRRAGWGKALDHIVDLRR